MIYYSPKAVITDELDKVIHQLDYYAGDCPLLITSGKRNPSDQLRIIAQYALKKEVKYPEMNTSDYETKVNIEPFGELHRWTRTWSKLLTLDIMVNPPVEEKCLWDYLHPTKGRVRAGTIVHASPHFRGTAFDISGVHGVDRVVGIISAAVKGGVPIKDFLIERDNNCIHVDINPEGGSL